MVSCCFEGDVQVGRLPLEHGFQFFPFVRFFVQIANDPLVIHEEIQKFRAENLRTFRFIFVKVAEDNWRIVFFPPVAVVGHGYIRLRVLP